jgi:L-lactate dehydrogenase complex protein LldE
MKLDKDIDLFVPCCMDRLYANTVFRLLRLFEKLEVKVNYNPNQTCCGQTAFKNGFWNEAKEVGEKFIHDFNLDHYVVCPSASCVSYVKNYFESLFHNTGLHLEYKKLCSNIFELSDFLVNILRVTDTGATFEHTVTYHDSCTALREYDTKQEPRMLLSNVKGLNLVEMDRTEECCGFGNMFNLTFEPIAVAMAQEKLNYALASGAEYIVSTDASCLTHINATAVKQKIPIKCLHLVDVITSGI